MTAREQLIRARLGVLALADQLQNLNAACKRAGISRSHFYEIKDAFERCGRDGLVPVERRRPRMPNHFRGGRQVAPGPRGSLPQAPNSSPARVQHVAQSGQPHGHLEKLQRLSGRRIRAHQLRHTFATLMLEGGCDIYTLSQMMGHSDLRTTAIYLGASVEHMRAQMAKHPLSPGTQ